MIKPILKTSFLFVLLIFLSIQGSISLETENEDQTQQVMNTQAISKSLKMSPDYGKIPLYFIPNEGQVDEKAFFYAKASRYTLWLTKEGLVFDSARRIKKESTKSIRPNPKDINNPEDFKYDRDVSRLVFINANRSPEVIPVDDTEHKVNYFIGNDKSKWQTSIQTSKAVLYKELYRNIDLKVYGIEKQIEYDFVVRPGGEVSDINFEYKDVEVTKIDKEGNLVVETKLGELEHAKPECYQIIGGKRIVVEAKFKRIENNTYGFKVKEYNRNYELIIDPLVLVYSTYLGGSGYDEGWDIAVDLEGAVYVTGCTYSSDFPTFNPIQGNHAGGDSCDGFITKLNSSGSAIIYSTYLGGSEGDWGKCIAVDSEGAACMTGCTYSTDFPTLNPIQGSHAGGLAEDSFITKLNSSGSALVYSTYLGGNNSDNPWGISVDSGGVAYVAGCTYSTDFPTYNPIQGSRAGSWDVFITKIRADGSAFIFSTYLGGGYLDWGMDIAVDSEGAVYITGYTNSVDFPIQNPFQGSLASQGGLGEDAFITKINSTGSSLIYSTYLGGSNNDYGYCISVDSRGAVYITGKTSSTDFPIQNAIQGSHAGGWDDAFITNIDSSGSAIIYSTYLGGSDDDFGNGISVDSGGVAYVVGNTESYDFPIQNAIQGSHAGGWEDIFVTNIDSSGSAIIYSTYLGGSERDRYPSLAVDSEGAVYVTGYTNSVDFPIQNAIQGSHAGGWCDGFITKLNFAYYLTITATKGGTTDPKPGTHIYNAGTQVTITAIPDNGYKFSGWSGDVSSADNPITLTMDSDKSITANFEKEITIYTLSIESGSGGTTNPAPGIYSYEEGTEVTITAIPDYGYRFSHWSGDASGADNPITIAMDSDKSIKANFIRQHTLTTESGSGGTTNPSPGSYIYDKGTKVTITAIPDAHYQFSGWSGDRSGLANPITITMNSDKSIIASFVRIIYSPLNFTGQKVLNRSLSQAEYINVFSWQSNPNNVNIVKYRIYLAEGESRSLLVELNASTFEYWHRGVEKDKLYTYAICAVNNEDREGDPTHITVQ